MRSGHTEAAVDLCKLANLPPVGVICELANDDGTVMAGAQIAAFAETHKLKRISVADLIAYRQAREKLVERVATFPVESDGCGRLTGYAYVTPFDPVQHFAFVHGDIGDGRRHSRPGCTGPTSSPTSSRAAARSRRSSPGSRRRGRASSSTCATGRRAFRPARRGARGPSDSETLRTQQWREVGLGAQILRDLGVSSIRLQDVDAANLCRPVGLRHRDQAATSRRSETARAHVDATMAEKIQLETRSAQRSSISPSVIRRRVEVEEHDP